MHVVYKRFGYWLPFIGTPHNDEGWQARQLVNNYTYSTWVVGQAQRIDLLTAAL